MKQHQRTQKAKLDAEDPRRDPTIHRASVRTAVGAADPDLSQDKTRPRRSQLLIVVRAPLVSLLAPPLWAPPGSEVDRDAARGERKGGLARKIRRDQKAWLRCRGGKSLGHRISHPPLVSCPWRERDACFSAPKSTIVPA